MYFNIFFCCDGGDIDDFIFNGEEWHPSER